MNGISYRVALGGIVSALCLVTMFLAGIMPALYLVLPMVAGVLMLIIAEEVSKGWAFLTYLAVSILSMLITFDKEAALIFALFFGHYPILRYYIEKIGKKPVKAIVKLVIFNICVLCFFYITVYLFGLEQMLEEFDEFGKYGGLIMLGFANVVFVLYDYNLALCHVMYRKKLKPKFSRRK